MVTRRIRRGTAVVSVVQTALKLGVKKFQNLNIYIYYKCVSKAQRTQTYLKSQTDLTIVMFVLNLRHINLLNCLNLSYHNYSYDNWLEFSDKFSSPIHAN